MPYPGPSSSWPWEETSAPGISLLPLHPRVLPRSREPVEATVLIRMEPGCGYRPHRHVGVEEVYVLEGGYRDDRGEYRAGDYVRYEPESVHAPVALGDPEQPISVENPACVLFASARGGIEVLRD